MKNLQRLYSKIMKYPLIRNNFNREDLDGVISLPKQDDPRLTNGSNVQAFGLLGRVAWGEFFCFR